MKGKTMKRLALALLAILLPVMLAATLLSPVLAIDDPDTLQLLGAYVYEDCLEEGDVGVLLEYDIEYGVLPSDVITDSFLVIFLDSDGVTQIAATAPYAYVDNGFGRGVAWIYFTPEQVATYALVSASIDDYRVRLAGNPTVPSGWAGDPPTVTTTLDYWQTSGDASTLLGLRVLGYANTLGTAWGLSLSTPTAIGYRLTDTGATYFSNAIPNLRQMCSGIFQTGSLEPDDAGIDYTTEFGAVFYDLTGTAAGSPINLISGNNTIAVTATGTFGIELEQGTRGMVYDIGYGLDWDAGTQITTSRLTCGTSCGGGIVVMGTQDRHIWRSTDYGASWSDLGVIAWGEITSMGYLESGIALAGDTAHHIYRSTNYGLSWTDLGEIAQESMLFQVAYMGSGIVITGDDSGRVYRSTDYGATWDGGNDISSSGLGGGTYLESGIGVLGDGVGHIFRSTNYGVDWSDLGVIGGGVIERMAYLGNGIVLAVSAKHIHRSTNYGLSWSDLGEITISVSWGMAYLEDGVAIVTDIGKRIYRSDDYGQTWDNLGIIATGVISKAVDYLGNGIAIFGDYGGYVFISTTIIAGAPVTLVAGDNTITAISTGNITVYVALYTTQTVLTDTVIGTAFDLTDLGNAFGMSRLWISGVVWFIITLIICAAVYVRAADQAGMGDTSGWAGKVTFAVFDVCIIGGILLGLLSIIVGVLIFLACNAFIGYILFFKPANV